MSLTSAQLLNALISFTANFPTVGPAQLSLPIKNLPITFANVANLNIVSGTFTPTNNTKVIATALTSIAPNFIFLLVDQPILLTADDNFFSILPVQKVFLWTAPTIAGGGNPMNALTIDGRSNLAYAMAQSVAVNYTLVYGQATIS